MRPGRHLGRADRADQEGVEAPPLVDDLVGEHRAVAQVAGAAEVVVDGVERRRRRRATTFRASATTSGPIPSPPTTPMRCVVWGLDV